MRFVLLASLTTPLLVHRVGATENPHGDRRLLGPERISPGRRKPKSPKEAKKCGKPKFSDMFVFGDSLCDTGNIASIVPTYPPRIAVDGKFSVEYIAEEFGLDLRMSNHLIAMTVGDPALITGNNYGVGQAKAENDGEFISGPAQVNAFLWANQGNALSDALYVIFIGNNDILSSSYFDRYIRGNVDKTDKEVLQDIRSSVKSVIDHMIQPLINAGAQHIVVASPLSQLIPLVNLKQPEARAKDVAQADEYFNDELEEALISVKSLNGINIIHYQGLPKIVTKTKKLGLEMESPCVMSLVGVPGAIPPIPPLNGTADVPYLWDSRCSISDASKFFYWDEAHPSDTVHKFVAKAVIKQIRVEICPNKHSKTSKKASKPKNTKGSKRRAR